MKKLGEIWANRTARILIVAAAALLLLLACWLVFGRGEERSASGDAVLTEREQRLSALLSAVEDAGDVRVLVTESEGEAVSAVVLFDGADGILVRLRLTQIAAQALGIAENRVLVCPSREL